MLDDTSDGLTSTTTTTTTKQPDTKRVLKIETDRTANGGPKRRSKFTSDSDRGDQGEAKKAMEQVGMARRWS